MTAVARGPGGGSPAGSAVRLLRFARERFPQRIYATYAVLWVLGLRAALGLAASDGRLLLGTGTALDVLAVWLVLFFARAVDEQKDADYDAAHHPDRPLARGAVSRGELRAATAGAAAALVALAAARSWLLAALAVLVCGYTLFLVGLERWSRRVHEGLFLNLAVSYTVQLLVACYLVASYRRDAGSLPATTAGVVLIFVGAFLHVEFARKTSWQRRPGAHLYSNVVGPRGGVALVVGSAVGAGVLALALFRPPDAPPGAAAAALAPLAAYAFVVRGGRRFLRREAATWPPGDAMLFLAAFYLGLVVLAAVALPVAAPGWGG